MPKQPEPKYPHIVLSLGNLSGPEGNAFAILSTVQNAMRKSNVSEKEVTKFFDMAIDGDYNHLLQIVRDHVTIA